MTTKTQKLFILLHRLCDLVLTIGSCMVVETIVEVNDPAAVVHRNAFGKSKRWPR